MKTVLLFGAGRSATVLIDYLLENAITENWQLVLVDADLSLASAKIGSSQRGKAQSFDINDSEERGKQIRQADLVISLLPPSLHIEVARDCLNYQRNLLTASYVDPQIKALEPLIKKQGLFFLYEMGLDPGIDHMSAMKLFDEIHALGGEVRSFLSHCGGLVSPESDDNPWHYKISWNARNIILAGKAGAHFLEDGQEKRISYEDLFSLQKTIDVPGIGELGWYPNRDSMSYIPLYGLKNLDSFIRTTLRHPDFLFGWKNLVDLELTDETMRYETAGRSLQDLFKEHLDQQASGAWRKDKLLLKQLLYLGLEDGATFMDRVKGSAADILQFAAEKKLSLHPQDKDMIVMMHQIGWTLNGASHQWESSLVVKGENNLRTAMARTVGLPLGIAARHILNGKIRMTGLHIPTARTIYEPVLEELEQRGVRFEEKKK